MPRRATVHWPRLHSTKQASALRYSSQRRFKLSLADIKTFPQTINWSTYINQTCLWSSCLQVSCKVLDAGSAPNQRAHSFSIDSVRKRRRFQLDQWFDQRRGSSDLLLLLTWCYGWTQGHSGFTMKCRQTQRINSYSYSCASHIKVKNPLAQDLWPFFGFPHGRIQQSQCSIEWNV